MWYRCITERENLVVGMGSVREGRAEEHPEDAGRASKRDEQEDIVCGGPEWGRVCGLLEPIRTYTKLGHWYKMLERMGRVRLYGPRWPKNFVPSPKGSDRV